MKHRSGFVEQMIFSATHMSIIFRYIATVIILCICGIMWYAAVYMPLARSIAFRAKIMHQFKNDEQHRVMQMQEHQRVSTAVDVHKAQLKIHEDAHAISEYSAVAQLIELAQKIGLQFQIYNPINCVKKEWCTKKICDIALEGTYEQIKTFFNRIASLPGMLLCKNSTIRYADSHEKLHLLCQIIFVNTKKDQQ